MSKENDPFVAICEWLKHMGDSTNAGRAYIDFTRDNGDVFRIEYLPSKKQTK